MRAEADEFLKQLFESHRHRLRRWVTVTVKETPDAFIIDYREKPATE